MKMRSEIVIKQRLRKINQVLKEPQMSYSITGYHNYVTLQANLKRHKQVLEWVLNRKSKKNK